MKIVNSPPEMKNLSLTAQSGGSTVGLVPTMGALHEGHLSLLKLACQYCDFLVMSIFVNPAQFGPAEDLAKYPRPFERDCELAAAAGCDCLFVPQPQDMYPENYSTYVNVENISDTLCGASRPAHFRGVTTVVLKLFNIVSPQIAVFGQKDVQQLVVIKRMCQDLNLSVKILTAPIIREESGLAMSSRNVYLSEKERRESSVIYKSLMAAQELYESGERSGEAIRRRVRSIIDKSDTVRPEYVEVVDTARLKSVDKIDRKVIAALACRTSESGTRLIDNIILGGDL
ncbi:MAG: pantoate--beta-alanine ligase [Chitinispirillales bacterium]|jgi:pantoate--beta-alanine ligase|nr:pantoate--beta-alanine ligase [Chitinispirillales bacterium]